MLSEAKDIAEELGDTEIRAEAMAWRVPALVALCDLESARHEVAAVRAIASRPRSRSSSTWPSTTAPRSRCATAASPRPRRAAQRSHEWGRLLTGRDASGVYGIQMFSIRREQGRLAELAPVIRILAGDPARTGPWRPGLRGPARRAGHGGGRAARARARRCGDGLDPFRESLWLGSLAYLTDACAALGDEAAAALLYPELEPFAGGNVMIGHLVSCYGAADRYLGMLAATLGEAERAERHFERAMELNRRMGAATWLAHTAYEYGRMLLAHGPASATGRRRCSARPRRSPSGSGCPRCWPGSARSARAAPAPRLPDGLSPREVQILGLVASGFSNRQVGSVAVDQRAHGRQPHPQHPAQDRLREPDRGRVVRPPARAEPLTDQRSDRACRST